MLSLRPIVSTLCLLLLAGCGDAAIGDSFREARPSHPVPFSTNADYLTYWDGAGYQPFFVKGMNLGVGVPGTQPGELAITRAQYRRWFQRMGEMGINVLRIYTLHYPRFYEELAAYNRDHPDQVLLLMQGIWLDEENPTHDFFNMTEIYDAEIEKVVSATHGDAVVEQEYGKAFGTYTTDVSEWVVSWVVGREIYPDEVVFTNEQHPDEGSFEGRAVSIYDAMPMEAWLAARIDYVVNWERDHYGVTRPVAFSSWPTLDPLIHEIEGHGSDEDRVNMGLDTIIMHDAPGGFYMIFHAYPYYPDFIVENPEYQLTQDAFGSNSYAGYLEELKAYYHDIPVLIGEFGTPTSWGNAHYAQNGMHHGGHDETVSGHYAARMLENFLDTGCAGGVYFAWMDEWWKRTWITDELDFPRNRRFRWHNVTAAEQNFGVISFDLGPPEFDAYPPVSGEGGVEQIEVDTDAAFFHVRLTLTAPQADDQTLVIGFDTYRDDLGESLLPDGVATANRNEFALTLRGDEANMLVTEAYDTYGIWHATSDDLQLFHSVPSDQGAWTLVRWKNNSRHVSLDRRYEFPETANYIGVLRVRDAADPVSNQDAVVRDGRVIEFRVPWTLLQFNDPSTRSVLDDDRRTPGRETAESEGVALSVSYDGVLVETSRFSWQMWDVAPPTIEREKPSLELYAEAVRSLPTLMPRDDEAAGAVGP